MTLEKKYRYGIEKFQYRYVYRFCNHMAERYDYALSSWVPVSFRDAARTDFLMLSEQEANYLIKKNS